MHKTTSVSSRAKGVDAAGILFSRDLPHRDFDGLWESIILDKELKDRLHAQAALNFTLRPRVKRDRVRAHFREASVVLSLDLTPRSGGGPRWA